MSAVKNMHLKKILFGLWFLTTCLFVFITYPVPSASCIHSYMRVTRIYWLLLYTKKENTEVIRVRVLKKILKLLLYTTMPYLKMYWRPVSKIIYASIQVLLQEYFYFSLPIQHKTSLMMINFWTNHFYQESTDL